MRRCRISVFVCLLLMSFMLTACIKAPDELPPQEKKKTSEYSENILLSINQGAAGWGTIYDCMDAEIFIYKDKSVRVMVYEPEETEIFELLQGKWICESGSAYIWFYEMNNNYYMDCYGDWQIHECVEYFIEAPLYELYYGYFDKWKEEEDTIQENEIRVAYTTNKGELSYGGEFVVDKDSAYLISELMQEDKAYYFYPYEGEMPIWDYVHIHPMAQKLGEIVGDEKLQYEALWQVAEKLVSSNLIYLYPGHEEVKMLEDGTYKIETLACGYKETGGTAKNVDYNLLFFIDEEGNPIRELEWEIKED